MTKNKRAAARQGARRRQTKKKRRYLPYIIGGIVVIVLGCFLFFQSHFLPTAKVNGVDVGFLSVTKAKKKLASLNAEKTIQLISPEKTYTINLPDRYEISSKALEKQLHQLSSKLAESTTFEETLLAELNALDLPAGTVSQDASIVFENNQFQIVPEVVGTDIDKERLIQQIMADVKESADTYKYQLASYYRVPQVTQDSPELVGRLQGLQNRLAKQITLNINGQGVTLTSEEIAGLLQADGNGDPEKIAAYINNLNGIYASDNKGVTFTTIHGTTKNYSNNGRYGWGIEPTSSAEKLKSAIESANQVENVDLELTGNTSQNSTISGNYVEIDLDAQRMYLYIDGAQLVDTPVITGGLNKRSATLPGFHTILAKTADTFLQGRNLSDVSYKVPVKYWMPLISKGGVVSEIGIHDASWNNANYGNATAYATSAGSLGCINTPEAAAGTIFANAYVGMPVIIYGHIYDNAPNEFQYPVEYGD